MPEPVFVRYHQLVDEHGKATDDRIASLCINRPGSANAFSGDILDALKAQLETISQQAEVRALLFQSVGKHFSAGADLGWMKQSAQLSQQHNLEEADKLTGMFEQLAQMPIPTIAVVKGAAYGGAVGIIACCDYAVALEGSRMCLSEARIGLIPAVILPYLSRKFSKGDLRRNTLTARVFNCEEALHYGLIQAVATKDSIGQWLVTEIDQLLGTSPAAQRSYKSLQDQINSQSFKQGHYTAEAIASIRASKEGKEGLQAFFEKRSPSWVRKIGEPEGLFIS